jgi:hypothetical protein
METCQLCNQEAKSIKDLTSHIRRKHPHINLKHYYHNFGYELPLCACGCGKEVVSPHHKFVHGHNIRVITKIDKQQRVQVYKQSCLAKYGVDNVQKVPKIKAKTVKTRMERYSHWMGDLDEEGLKQLSIKCAKGGKIGGEKNAKLWKENPELFKKFQALGHQAQRDNGSYERRKGDGNVMADPNVKIRHQKAVKEAMNNSEVIQKMKDTAYLRTPFVPRLENHYRWKGGISFTRGIHWKKIRIKIIKRDGKKCVVCGSKYRLHVHHIISVATGENIDKLNEGSNLVTLCIRCHMKHEFTHCFDNEIKNWMLKIN